MNGWRRYLPHALALLAVAAVLAVVLASCADRDTFCPWPHLRCTDW